MKKSTSKKPLNLSKQTVRTLTESALELVPGGAMNNSAISRCWASGCTCPN